MACNTCGKGKKTGGKLSGGRMVTKTKSIGNINTSKPSQNKPIKRK